ncbi:MAG: glycosyltransferase [Anaerolineales bacterium]|nr:glycosyltransferase [Anaerolineales bacterium]
MTTPVSSQYTPLDLSVVIPALNEAENLSHLLPQVRERLDALEIQYEIIVVDELANDQTRQVIAENKAVLLTPDGRGYGGALRAGFTQARGEYIISMDADLSHSPDFLCELWGARTTAEVVIASRYVKGGQAHMPFSRLVLSRILNLIFSWGLGLRTRDMSSGYRLYKAHIVKCCQSVNSNFDALQELLVHILIEGYRVKEVPFHYRPRQHGSSHARVLKFGMAYLRTFGRLWRLRNSISSADYDWRAYTSLVLPQRYWQRQRYKHITALLSQKGSCLDIGCGSSRILGALPAGSVALDILARKLRFARHYFTTGRLVQGSLLALPIRAESFSCVVCSQVIEHIPRDNVFDNLDRVLMPGGTLILGTPDYARWQWKAVEWLYGKLLPQAYADEHITHYTDVDLIDEFVKRRGYRLEAKRYILRGELILALVKPNIQTD